MTRALVVAMLLALVVPAMAQERSSAGMGASVTAGTATEARAPVAGIVLFVRAVPSMSKGETVAYVGPLARWGGDRLGGHGCGTKPCGGGRQRSTTPREGSGDPRG